MRGLVIGRKNHYGSKSRRGTEVAALFYTIFETAKLAGIDPKAYRAAPCTRSSWASASASRTRSQPPPRPEPHPPVQAGRGEDLPESEGAPRVGNGCGVAHLGILPDFGLPGGTETKPRRPRETKLGKGKSLRFRRLEVEAPGIEGGSKARFTSLSEFRDQDRELERRRELDDRPTSSS